MDAESFIGFVIDYVTRVLLYTGGQILLLFAPALFFAFLTQYLSEKIRTCGWGKIGSFYTYLTAPGTFCHECGHALFVLLFRYKLTEFVGFRPSEDGTLGYIGWATDNNKNLRWHLAHFFVGTGPIWLGSLVIALLAFLVLGKENLEILGISDAYVQDFSSAEEVGEYAMMVLDSGLTLFFNLFSWDVLKHPLMLFCLYLIFCIGGHMKLSPPDMQSAKIGFLWLFIPIFVFNVATAWIGDFPMKVIYTLTQYNHVLYSLLIFVTMLLLVAWLLTVIVGSFKKH